MFFYVFGKRSLKKVGEGTGIDDFIAMKDVLLVFSQIDNVFLLSTKHDLFELLGVVWYQSANDKDQ